MAQSIEQTAHAPKNEKRTKTVVISNFLCFFVAALLAEIGRFNQ
jgi:hypothetical protein